MSSRTSPSGPKITWQAPVETAGALPPDGNKSGDTRVTLDTGHIWVWNGTAWVDNGGAGSGVEVLNAADGTSTPISLGVQQTILINQTDVQATWHLPDGSEGLVKEIVSGGPLGSPYTSSNGIVVTCSNSAFGGNDSVDFSPGVSIRMVWVTALGGWCALNYCGNVNVGWD